ncbi:hypothetical protein TI39_contig4185g00005 [Zymoseptoria brevis]|uniref:Apple domain-containing protein n=1 Tax=Zymoseptoria brevis TaxID=1047168 RepID=A0A0F4GBY7_9PEZI|nr:hypothetical protein TI39_contig4185g00005 [Zymoseptoria brevis]
MMDPSPSLPQRMSALYQYHNAPEVAPAHGLEYDDNVYPSSDKYPVLRELPASVHDRYGRHAFDNDNRPPRIIFGMKIKTFLIVAAIMILIVVGAAVGGAVGGKQLRDQHEADIFNNATSPSRPSTASASSTYNAPIPTYEPLSDCPDSDNTLYTSSFAHISDTSTLTTSSNTSHASAGLSFTKHCALSNPITDTAKLTSAFVYSFSDCVEVCAAYNYWADSSECSVAVYQSNATRPANCWIGKIPELKAGSLKPKDGIDVATLEE